jgi:hypothetical protein
MTFRLYITHLLRTGITNPVQKVTDCSLQDRVLTYKWDWYLFFATTTNIIKIQIFPHSVIIHFLLFSKRTVIISLHSIIRLLFVTDIPFTAR